MSLSSVPALLATVAAETGESDPPIPAWAVGLIAFGLLIALLVGLVSFGGGREHS